MVLNRFTYGHIIRSDVRYSTQCEGCYKHSDNCRQVREGKGKIWDLCDNCVDILKKNNRI